MSWRLSSLFRPPNYATAPFEVLQKGCVKGDDVARRELLARYEPLVWRTVLCRLSRASREDQEEVVANTFIALLADDAQALARYDARLGLSPEGYIRRQAILQCTNRYRSLHSQKRRAELPLDSENEDGLVRDRHPDPSPDAEARLASEGETRRLLEQFRSGLSPALALTFELMFVRELDPAEVADALGCSMDVVYTRKKRILGVLEQLMATAGADAR